MLNIRLVRAPEFIHARPQGTLDVEASREALCQLLAEGTEGAGRVAGAYDLLFDLRRTEIDLELKEVWALMDDLDACDPGFDGRLALLDNWDDTFDRAQFFEASSERIGIESKAFLEFEKAVNWLWASRSVGHGPSDAGSTAGDS
jgi:hypothetical protein